MTLQKIQASFDGFWMQCPALLYGVAICIGSAYALGALLEASIMSAALVLPLCLSLRSAASTSFLRLGGAVLLCAGTAIWVHGTYAFPSLPAAGVKGEGVVSIDSVARQAHPFGSRWLFRGTLHSFVQDGRAGPSSHIRNVPLSVSVADTEGWTRPSAAHSYLINGTLKVSENGKYTFQPAKQSPWRPLVGSWSLAETRYALKQGFAEKIKDNYQSPQSQSFLTGIATGNFDDRAIAQDFSRFGLQHIMAISGFHFSIIAGFFSIILGALLPKRAALAVLIGILTAYFLFLGASASIMRAWMMCTICCLGIIFERQPYGLNTLGIALIGVMLYDPLQVLSLGFQFSFATTAAILLLYPPFDKAMQSLFRKRSLHQALEMPSIDKHAYVLLCTIRQGLSLTLAVNIVALPITLFYFHKFPWMGLLFNLFFPFLVSIAMILLLAAFGTSLTFLHKLNDGYTQLVLNLTTYTPKAFDVYIRMPDAPSWVPVAFVTGIFVLGIYLRRTPTQESEWSFV